MEENEPPNTETKRKECPTLQTVTVHIGTFEELNIRNDMCCLTLKCYCYFCLRVLPFLFLFPLAKKRKEEEKKGKKEKKTVTKPMDMAQIFLNNLPISGVSHQD